MIQTATFGSRLKKISSYRATWPLLALVVIFIVDGIISPNFYEIRIVEGRLFGSIIDIFYRATPIAMIGIGMAVVIGTKGIDLSVGSIVAICGAVIAWRIHAGDPHIVILFMVIFTGLACGLWNGFLVAILGIQPIIATLILMVSGRGIGLLVNSFFGGTDPSFESVLLQGLSTGHIWLIPTRLFVGAFVFFLVWLLVRRTAFGLFAEAVGVNSKASDLAGVNAKLVTLGAYLVCGFCTAWAAVLFTADTHTSDPVSVALYIELDAILAVVIGGGSLAGGRIFLGMTVLGAVIIQALTTSILISGLPPEYNLVVKAVVVLFVLLLQSDNLRQGIYKFVSRRTK